MAGFVPKLDTFIPIRTLLCHICSLPFPLITPSLGAVTTIRRQKGGGRGLIPRIPYEEGEKYSRKRKNPPISPGQIS